MPRRLAVLLGCALALAVPACGGDPDAEPLPDAPELVPPGNDQAETDSATDTTETETTETDADTDGTTGAAPAPDGAGAGTGTPTAGSGSGGGTSPPEDTPENDTPPPAGSPAERAERFCEQNPGAC